MEISAPTQVKVPVRTGAGRPSEPNPFLDLVKALGPDSRTAEVAQAIVIKSETKDEHTVDIRKVRRQLGNAGAEHGVTVGIDVVPGKDGKSSQVTFWTRPRINRTRAEGGAEASA